MKTAKLEKEPVDNITGIYGKAPSEICTNGNYQL